MSTLMGQQSLSIAMSMPLMTPAAFSLAMGIELSVFQAQCNRGYWPTIKVGKRVFINVEAVRIKAAERAAEFAL
ncbi:MAG: hypothetical protein LKF64_06255 [Alcaligenes faecalis]|uniref:hypothetical protein n=1 Tax=Alcaligenes phenolicus TaxID=232846 RepID=UPI002AA6FEFB|nr:hypothetical protein [Alcaligenes phenolicus]MCH4224581.1 hypothetical protein [Alcaligenes faecalis]